MTKVRLRHACMLEALRQPPLLVLNLKQGRSSQSNGQAKAARSKRRTKRERRPRCKRLSGEFGISKEMQMRREIPPTESVIWKRKTELCTPLYNSDRKRAVANAPGN
jgi:hypothetical protein